MNHAKFKEIKNFLAEKVAPLSFEDFNKLVIEDDNFKKAMGSIWKSIRDFEIKGKRAIVRTAERENNAKYVYEGAELEIIGVYMICPAFPDDEHGPGSPEHVQYKLSLVGTKFEETQGKYTVIADYDLEFINGSPSEEIISKHHAALS